MTHDTHLATRIGSEVSRKFASRCWKLNTNRSDMLRELVTAFTEDRITIRIPETRKQEQENLYES